MFREEEPVRLECRKTEQTDGAYLGRSQTNYLVSTILIFKFLKYITPEEVLKMILQ